MAYGTEEDGISARYRIEAIFGHHLSVLEIVVRAPGVTGEAETYDGSSWAEVNNVNTKSSNYLWNQLKISFQEKDTIIICHIKNHYALIFGLRKYNHMKEVLTSRKGQSPKHWIPWKDLLHTICTYRIYNIVSISKGKSYNMSYSGFRF